MKALIQKGKQRNLFRELGDKEGRCVMEGQGLAWVWPVMVVLLAVAIGAVIYLSYVGSRER